jgi:uncharacterized protein involved in outer membrane biogenesis
MNNFLIGLAAFIIAVIAALFGIPKIVDWNAYRGVFEEEATRFLGRDVRVGGAVNLKLLPAPYFSFEKVRVADSDTSSGEPFFRAESVTVWLSVAPFLRGAVEASEIELKRPVVRLVLNAEGGGNWQTFGQGQSALPFTPKDVALQSVRISDGLLSLHEADGSERIGLSAINGELGTPALEGPYRFRGTYGTGPSLAELRVNTAKPEADRAVRFKASHKRVSSGITTSVDGRILKLDTSPQIEGELTAQAPVVRAKGAASADAPVELKAQLTADTKAFKLNGLTLAFEQQGRPQEMTGDASGTWANGISVETALSAKWLDLDQIVGLADQQSPLTALLDMTANLKGLGAGISKAAAVVTVDQANLGHEAVSGVKLSSTLTDGTLRIGELKLGLPGGSRADIQGQFTSENAAFDGDVTLRGSSASRFANWLSGGAVVISPLHDGVFAVRSHITSTPGTIVARDFAGEMGGTQVTGDLGYTWQGRRVLRVALDGAQLDLGSVLSGSSSAGVFDAFAGLGGLLPDMDATVRIHAGQVLVPGRVFHDVIADADLKDKRLAINQFRLTGDNGYTIELDGDVRDLATKPKGTVRGVVTAETIEGAAALQKLFAWPDEVFPAASSQAALLPLRLAGSANLGTSGSEPVDISADGTLGRVRARATARLAKGYLSWQDAHGDFNVTLDAADPEDILTVLGRVPSGPARPVRIAAAAASQFRAVAAGIPNDGLAALITLDAPDTALSFRGTVGTNKQGVRVAGDLSARAANGQQLVQLLRGWPAVDLNGVPIDGVARLDMTPDMTRLQRIALNLATTSITGDLTITPVTTATGAPMRRRIEGRIDAGDLPVLALLAPVLQRTAMAKASAPAGAPGVWPDDAIDFARIESIEGAVEMTAGRMLIGDRLSLDDVKMTVAFDPKQIEIRSLEGDSLGGRWSGAWRLDRIAGGAQMSGAARVTQASLDALLSSAGRQGSASGVFNGIMTLSGKGTSLRTLFASAAGSGSIDLGEAQIGHLPPQGVLDAIEAAMVVPAETFGAALRQSLQSGRETMRLTVGPRALPFDITDGALRLKAATFELVDGLVRPALSIDLITLDAAAAWAIEARARPSPQAAGKSAAANAALVLPPVKFMSTGRLGDLANAATRLDSETLERELAVRKMERDLLELERLRQLDEERARAEAARREAGLPPEPQPGAAQGSGPANGFATVVTPATPGGGDQPAAPAETKTVPVPAPRPAARPAVPQPDYQPYNAEQMKKVFGGG